MVTKQQHYYPRSLMKYFADEDGKVNTYIRQANRVRKMSYEKICSANYTYESNGIADNILENKLASYETKMGRIIDYIHNNITSDNFIVTKEQQKFLYLYMYLQYLRTDAGRINYISLIENIKSYIPRKGPIELDEIKENEEKIKKFNWLFKQEGVLEEHLKQYSKPDSMNFHIAISRNNILTSDNPVIGTDEWKQIIMPISPFLCIEFQDDSINVSKNVMVELSPEKIIYLNEATINTANYYIISHEPFTFSQNVYIYNRFMNKNWNFGKPHFKNYDLEE